MTISANNPMMCSGSIICLKNVEKLKRVVYLLISVLAILFFMFYLGPKLQQPLGLKPIADFIDERDIEANMYFYTEVELFSEAHVIMENSMMYPPRTLP